MPVIFALPPRSFSLAMKRLFRAALGAELGGLRDLRPAAGAEPGARLHRPGGQLRQGGGALGAEAGVAGVFRAAGGAFLDLSGVSPAMARLALLTPPGLARAASEGSAKALAALGGGDPLELQTNALQLLVGLVDEAADRR